MDRVKRPLRGIGSVRDAAVFAIVFMVLSQVAFAALSVTRWSIPLVVIPSMFICFAVIEVIHRRPG